VRSCSTLTGFNHLIILCIVVLMNLPLHCIWKVQAWKCSILLGIIPGTHKPKLTINSYLEPLVAELNLLWKGQIRVRPHGALTAKSTELLSSVLVVMCQLQGKCAVLQGMHCANAVQSTQDTSLAQWQAKFVCQDSTHLLLQEPTINTEMRHKIFWTKQALETRYPWNRSMVTLQ